MKQFLPLVFVCLSCFLLLSCKKEATGQLTDLALVISHEADGKPMLPDTLLYQQAPGTTYSISKLEYYISNIWLVDKQGHVAQPEGVFYVNGFDNQTTTLLLRGVKSADYVSLQFNIGLIPAANTTGALPHTLVNANMAWPDPMGGGYHFLKFEGNYKPAGNTGNRGFAMHLGRNENLVEIKLNTTFRVDQQHPQLQLVMNLNEWFRNPHLLQFEVDGTNSMFDQAYMQKLKQNSATVFTIKTGN